MLPSDEEVLELPSSDGDGYNDRKEGRHTGDNSGSSEDEIMEDEELDENWGVSRKDYYNADEIETEADAVEEEEEALRLQQKQLQGMTEADFGFDEADWIDNEQEFDGGSTEQEHSISETLPLVEITEHMPVEERRRILISRFPEFEALSKEFVSLEGQYDELWKKAQAISAHQGSPDSMISGSVLKWRALAAYLGVLSMYFVLLTSGPLDESGNYITINPTELRRHPIMENLFQARTQWEQIRSLSIPVPDLTNGHTNGQVSRDEGPLITKDDSLFAKKPRPKKKQVSKAEARAAQAKVAAEAKRAEELRKTRHDLAQIAAKSSRNPKTKDITSDLGEMTEGTRQQVDRKKSLAFYTSQIAAKAQKRSLASKGAGGDDDIPYKERFRDKISRLNAEAAARGKNNKDALGDASDEEDVRVAAEVREQAVDEDYYQTIASKTKSKREDKAARAIALKEAASHGAHVREVERVGADGKRAITYAIEKNKGLTPKRKKEARNPRVKKRLKYEEKMKKLGSIRQLYKGGEGRGGYGGEMTGIKSSIVRSRKL